MVIMDMKVPIPFSPSSLLLLALLLLLPLLLFLRLLLLHRPSTNHRLPPSPPWNLPFLGHFHLLPRFFSYSFVLQQRRLLGPVYSIRFGTVTTIFVSSASLTHEALVQKSPIFSSRRQSTNMAVLSFHFRDINSSNGAFWRAARKNLAQTTLSPATLQKYQPFRTTAMDFLLTLLRKGEAERLGALPVLRMGMLHYALSMCFGFSFDDEAMIYEMSTTLEKLFAQFFPLTFSDFYPYLRLFLAPGLNRNTEKLLEKDRKMLRELIEEHQEKKKEVGSGGGVFEGNYVDSLLERMNGKEEKGVDSEIDFEDVLTLTTEFLEANTTTLATTLEWAMARLVKHPSVQEKLYCHIHDVVGDYPVQEEDIPKLPYLRAFVMEVLRLHPPAPILLPRETTEDCELGGYFIPGGSVVSFCVAAIGRDPEVWDNPTQFLPERMLGLDLDITGTKKMTMLPFGAGRRYCPGMAIGRLNLEMVVARAVQEFQWLPSPAGVDLSEHLRLSVSMSKPLRPLLRSRRQTV